MDVTRRFAALLMVIALGAGVSPARAVPDEETTSKNLPVSSNVVPDEPLDAPGVSLPDLSLLGTIALGVIGLFWIRRHTSEL